MKKNVLILVCLCISSIALAQVKLPAPSPGQTIKQDFGMSSIELTYSRPSLRGRKMIGDADPFNVVWRTGANAATRIRFNDPVDINGNKVDSGTYVIYTIPQKEGDWTFILNRGIHNSGVDGYKESEDVFRTKARTVYDMPRLETFTMEFSDVKPESCQLRIMWDNYALFVPIKTDVKEKVRAQIEAGLKTDKQPYWAAAQFYAEYDHNNKLALEMIDKAIAQNAKSNPFYMVHYKAKIQKDLGDKAGAIATANESIKMAKEAKNDDYVRLNEKLIASIK